MVQEGSGWSHSPSAWQVSTALPFREKPGEQEKDAVDPILQEEEEEEGVMEPWVGAAGSLHPEVGRLQTLYYELNKGSSGRRRLPHMFYLRLPHMFYLPRTKCIKCKVDQ